MNLDNVDQQQHEGDDVFPLSSSALDPSIPFTFGHCDTFEHLFSKDVAIYNDLQNPWHTGAVYEPWNPNDPSLPPTSSTLAAIEDHQDFKGQTESGLSSLAESELSTPYFESDFTPLVDLPLKNVEVNGAQWEHVEDVALEPDEDEILRRHSLDSLRAAPELSTNREGINNRSKSATHAELLKPRRRRGRKPSNLSPEEKRRRRLERGRLAANKCRRKKRELENMLEDRAKTLLAERNTMLKINSELRIEIQSLLEEVMSHSHAACGGITEAAGLLAYAAPPEYKILPQSHKVADLENTLADFCPPQSSQLQSPCLSKSLSSCPLEALNLDPPSPTDMMDIIFAGPP